LGNFSYFRTGSRAPSYLATFGILFALRLEAEERMMLEAFGDEYRSYQKQTMRIIPGVW
jgi:protein-S-isoprenylcysteine O-methyltransferase Ste14